MLDQRISCFQFWEYFIKPFFFLTLVVVQKSRTSNVKTNERMVRTVKHSYSTKEKKSVKKLLFNSLKKATTHPSLLIKRRKLFSFQKLGKKFWKAKNCISNWNSHSGQEKARKFIHGNKFFPQHKCSIR